MQNASLNFFEMAREGEGRGKVLSSGVSQRTLGRLSTPSPAFAWLGCGHVLRGKGRRQGREGEVRRKGKGKGKETSAIVIIVVVVMACRGKRSPANG